MQRAIEILMQEHRIIIDVIASLVRYAERGPTEVRRSEIADYASFFRGFADQCHHGKEEDLLFEAMVKAGAPARRGPIGVMLQEHEGGREHVRSLAALGARSGELSVEEHEELVFHARNFAILLRNHIAKEDNVLYPMAVSMLPADQLDRLTDAFDAFERNTIGEGEHERYHALAHRLIELTSEPSERAALGEPAPANLS